MYSIACLLLFTTYMGKRASPEDVHAKRVRLNTLGKESFASKRAISKLCENLKDEGIPECTSRKALFNARKGLCATKTPYGLLVETVPAPTKRQPHLKIGLQNPLSMLFYAALMSPTYSTLLRATMEAKPCKPESPWSLILYQDGVDPSDGLAKNHSRKGHVFYWNILEFGMSALASEETWFTPCYVRADVIKEQGGGIPWLTQLILHRFFDPHGFDAEYAGIDLQLYGGGHMCVYLKLRILLADEPGLKEMLSCKGHAGNKPCVLCKNATLHQTAGGGVPWHIKFPEYAKSIASPTMEGFIPHSDASIRKSVTKLDTLKPLLNKTQFEEKEAIFGFTWNINSIITDSRLLVGVASCLHFDWCHILVCDGCVDHEFGLFMHRMQFNRRTAASYTEIRQFLSEWVQPKHWGNMQHLFTDDANRNNHKKASFNCSASEMMTLAPLLRRYCVMVLRPRGEELAYVESMIAAFEVLELCMRVKRGGVSPDTLRRAIEKHLTLFKAAWGDNMMKPKHHYCLHLPSQLLRHGTLLSTHTHERRHRLVKRQTRDRKILESFDLGAIEEITCHQIFELENPFLKFGIQDAVLPRALTRSALQDIFADVAEEHVKVGAAAILVNGTAKLGDFVAFETTPGEPRVGEVLAFVVVGDREVALVDCWNRGQEPVDDAGFAKFYPTDSTSIIALSAVRNPVLYKLSARRHCCVVYLG